MPGTKTHNLSQELQMMKARKPYEIPGAAYGYCAFCDTCGWVLKVKDPKNPAMSSVACGACREDKLLKLL